MLELCFVVAVLVVTSGGGKGQFSTDLTPKFCVFMQRRAKRELTSVSLCLFVQAFPATKVQ